MRSGNTSLDRQILQGKAKLPRLTKLPYRVPFGMLDDLFEKWDNWCIDMDDRVLWGSGLSIWEKINRTIHTKFKNIR